ncbi:MAG: PhnD/SsuA/transferrin family substrate-binding protein [Acidobacteriota bacterium]
MRRSLITVGGALLLAGLSLAGDTGGATPLELVVCAPGFPGTTEEARPAMDRLASLVADAAGWPAGRVSAVYEPEAAAGRQRLALPGHRLALVPFSFFWTYAEELDLDPILQVARAAKSDEIWSLVARRGEVRHPADLAGWQVRSVAGFSPEFVRGPLLSSWGSVPLSTRIAFASRILGALRQAAAGEKVAVLLDPPQTRALDSLPFHDDLEVVMRSPGVPGFLLCNRGQDLSAGTVDALTSALIATHRHKAGRAVLESLRMARFEPLTAPVAHRSTAAGGGAGKR